MFHQPVLLKETVEYLDVREGEKYIDATLGGGGHTAAILESGGRVLGIDVDPEALNFAKKNFGAAIKRGQLKIAQGNFKNISQIAKKQGFQNCAGILFDLGMSSWQIDNSERGFSFMRNEELDMRMDPCLAVKAKDLLGGLKKHELEKLFTKYAEDKYARAIAEAVACSRNVKKFETTFELAGLLAWLEEGEPGDFWNWYQTTFKKTPQKYGDYSRRARIFQALRIAVNDEINCLKKSLPRALRVLKAGGRLAVISFHSLEDKVVKNLGQKQDGVKILTRQPLRPRDQEVGSNPRARSAKLRVFEKL